MFADNGGHMIAARFDGPVELINYHAQDFAMNKSPSPPNSTNPNPRPGLWYAMETEWAKVLNGQQVLDNNGNLVVAATPNGQSVEVNIQPQFKDSTRPRRPTEFVVSYTYGGITPPSSPKTIPNP